MLAPAPASVRNGGSLAYAGGFVYGLRGDNSPDFWRYSVAGNTWSTRADTPADVNGGGSLNFEWSGGWNSGEVPLEPGQKYAVHLRAEKPGNVFQVHWRDANPLVLHLYDDAPPLPRAAHCDRLASRRVLGRVAQQVAQHLRHSSGVH